MWQKINSILKKLTVKQIIFLFNSFMVLISLLVMLLIGGTLISIFKDRFLSTAWKNAKISDNSFSVMEILKDADKYNEDWREIDNDLKKYNFRLYVKGEYGEIYSSIRPSEKEGVEGLLSINSNLNKVHIYYMNDVTVAQIKTIVNDEEYTLYAANNSMEKTFLDLDKGLYEVFIIVFIIVGILSIVGLLLISLGVTRILIKFIFKPVEYINDAANRIAVGTLDIPINYKREDEFKNVCDSFDIMQHHLKEGIERNVSYEKARTDMISGISHDLRTPLTSIKGFVKAMIDGVADTDEKRERYLEIVYRKSCDMEELLSKLFFFSKLETGRMPFFKKRVNISNFIENYVKNKKEELKFKGVEVILNEYDIDSEFVFIDREQIIRVMDNIVENSVKYSGTDKLTIEFDLKNVEKDTKVEISISDNGYGMQEEKLPHIFEQFYRGDESRNSKCDGNGLGMYVCQYIIKEHGGSIRAFNNNGLNIVIELDSRKES